MKAICYRTTILGAFFLFLCTGSPVYSAIPSGGTLTPVVPTVTWTGGPFTSAAVEEFVTWDPAFCTSLQCDKYFLTVNIPSSYYLTNPTYTVKAQISWTGGNTDFDLQVYDSAGNVVNSSGQANTTFELADLGQLTSGTYQVQVIAFTAVGATYNGSVTVGPPIKDNARLAKYKQGNFTFTPAKALTGPDGLLFGTQDLEPRAAFDALGNIYVAAIEGTPGGTDVWKSQDGGNTFIYLGQPDGAQAASALAGRTPGVGGGDEDIAIGTTGRVYMAALWGAVIGVPAVGGVGAPLAATMCTSTNGGAVWVDNPWAQDLPLVDRQWVASYGANTVYLTYQQAGAEVSGTNSLFVLKSIDGGLTFPQVTEITTPELGTQPDFQGNIVVDPQNGFVYTVFIGHPGNSIYIARSTDGGKTFILKLARQGENGVSFANVFPIMAVDKGKNLHVVYSDGVNIYLVSSSDQGSTWTSPVRVNNGAETKLGLAPWVDAGDAGKVNITWWATSSVSSLASDAKWKMYFAQTQNAFARNPSFSEGAASDVFHTGPICVNGTGCAAGTRNLAEYASNTVYLDGKALVVYPDDQHTTSPTTYFMKQTGGPTVISAAPQTVHNLTQEEFSTPQHYTLRQNYPNPFNPMTTIEYDLPTAGHVRLILYDVLGREVTAIVNADQTSGTHTAMVNATHLSSGVYYYKLVADNFVDVKRMSIIK